MTLPRKIDRPDASVACGVCKACCMGTNVALLPDDDLDLFKRKVRLSEIDPDTDAAYRAYDPDFSGYVLERDANGTCVYLSDAGCSVYGHRPITCRSFSCADLVKRITAMPAEQRARRHEIIESQIYKEGLARLTTPAGGTAPCRTEQSGRDA